MKLSVRILMLIVMLMIAASPLSVLKVAAQDAPITDTQISRIRGNCVTALNTLNQLHASDGLLRVNRGQLYESISSKLMVQFNTRVSRAGYDISSLKSITTNYQKQLDTFRNDYQTYEEKLSSTLEIKCSKQPVEFLNSVEEARDDRNKVHDDTVQLNQYISDYQGAITTFENRFNQPVNEENQ